MSFEKFFRLISYAAVFCGFLSLAVSGTFSLLGTTLFVAVIVASWRLEDSRWQISERLGTALIVLALPVFYFLWRLQVFGFSNAEVVLPGILARMILVLAAIKLLQKKSDRDWIFLYLMAFFEVLLAAGLNISASYFVTFIAYLIVMVCAVVAFEIRKTVKLTVTHKEPEHTILLEGNNKLDAVPIRRLPFATIMLIAFATLVGLPLFFLLPRVGGAGLGSSQNKLSTSAGFSETVRLGAIGTIQQNDAVVMRVRLDDNSMLRGDTHWRGIALDTFDNRSWKRSARIARQQFVRGDRDLIQVDSATGRDDLVVQTVYLEPLDSSILFGLSKIVGVEGDFPSVNRDSEGSISIPRSGDRMNYKVISDRSLPNIERLRSDQTPYSTEIGNYLGLPNDLDPRIAKLASEVTQSLPDRYSKAKAMESYLQDNFGYTLEMKAGGQQPLADFLFNVKEGHCEYFATAMAVMLRTQGIATRVVNGFQQGEYNDAANAWIVRQRDAHSWVEVYFPREKVWVAFDPTPFAGQNSSASANGLFSGVTKYLEAIETYWIQYFVAFDDQEQQSLVRTAQKTFSDYQAKIAIWGNALQEVLAAWWSDLRGDSGISTSLAAVAYGLSILATGLAVVLGFVWGYRKAVKLRVWAWMTDRFSKNESVQPIEFYDRMLKILARRNLVRGPGQTPLEFAAVVGLAEAFYLTEVYNRVRFGMKQLSLEEKHEVENNLRKLHDDEA